MTTKTITTELELKQLLKTSRRQITEINGVDFTGFYPVLEVSNKHAWYYDIDTQGNKFLFAPFNVTMK